jgi:hypothetical protein
MLDSLLTRFTLHDSDEEIGRRVEKKAHCITNLGRYQIGEACKLIETRMKAIYTPTNQCVRIIRELAGIARAHIASTYSDESDFLTKCHMTDLVPREPGFATALAGLGGTGKSQLLQAVERLLAREGDIIDVPGLPQYPFEPVWIMTMVSGKSLSALLEPFVGSGATGSAILKPAAKRAYTNCLGLLALDESQFITTTQAGHAKAAEVVMSATYVGPPLVFGANFSMINKLEKRPQQERDRLLSHVIVLSPEKHGSEAFDSIMSSQLEVLSEAVSSDKAISVKAHAEHIHNYTYGINRKSAILLNLAWRVSREEGSDILAIEHVEKAYKSDSYFIHREEVEILRSQAFQNKMARSDLWCSFAPPSSTNVIVADSLIRENEQRIADELLRSVMTKSEREAYDAVTQAEASTNKPRAKVMGFPKTDKSLTALQATGAALMNQFDPRK